MEIIVEDADVKLILNCNKQELKHIAKGIRLEGEDDDDDCDCGEKSCYECCGRKIYQDFKRKFLYHSAT